MTPMQAKTGKWAVFVLLSLASLVAYKTAWATSFYLPLLTCLAVAALVMGFVVLRQTGMKLWSLVAVAGGLLVGQWGVIQWLLVVAFGKFGGFAP